MPQFEQSGTGISRTHQTWFASMSSKKDCEEEGKSQFEQSGRNIKDASDMARVEVEQERPEQATDSDRDKIS